MGASGDGGGATAGGAQGPPPAAFAFAKEEEEELADAEEDEAAAAELAEGLVGFCWGGGTPRTRTWSAQTTALTPSMAKPIARSRMKTVADSAEAEGVCFFFFGLVCFFCE